MKDVEPFKFAGNPAPAANTTGASDAIGVSESGAKTVQVLNAGGGAFSVDIEGTLDGSTWGKLVTAITVNGGFAVISASITKIRLNVTASSGGATPTGMISWED